VKTAFSFAGAEATLARAASTGVAAAAESFASTLRANGERTSVETAPDGAARVVLEGAGAVQREFGTQSSPAKPVLGPALQANRPLIGESIARSIAQSLRGKP
jgi:hypothetical protein